MAIKVKLDFQGVEDINDEHHVKGDRISIDKRCHHIVRDFYALSTTSSTGSGIIPSLLNL